MARWMIYIRERFPLGTYLLLSFGFAVSGAIIGEGSPHVISVSWVAVGLLLFFAELRLMDEFKDYQKDLVAHPDRPLPRGVLKPGEVKKAIHLVFGLMLFYAGFCGIFFNPLAGIFCFAYTVYLWFMYQEFYIGGTLGQYPFLYAFTHQIIIIPICFFTVAAQSGSSEVELERVFGRGSFGYSLTVLGAFFGYEICRKLDPRSHPILRTYLFQYGRMKTISAVTLLLILAGYGATRLDAQNFLWPVEIAVAMSLILVVWKPERFKLVEVLASISLICHIWALPIQSFMRNN